MKSRLLFAFSLLVVCLALLILVGAGFLFPKKEPIAASPADHFVTVLDSKIRYRVYERKKINNSTAAEPVIVLLHGFGGTLDHWKEIQPLLGDYKSIALDLTGFGGSDRPAIAYDLNTQWTYLDGFMRALDIRNAIVVGISMGGSLSAWTAAKSRDRVSGLVMIAPSGLRDSLRKEWPFNWFYRPGIANRIAWVFVDNPLYRLLFKDSVAAQALGVTNSYNEQFEETLSAISQPALLAWSKGDDTTLFDYHHGYQKRIKNLEFLELPESIKHDVLRADPEGTASFVIKFIDKFRNQELIKRH